MGQEPLTVRRWKSAEYARLVELGVFVSDPIELLGGELIVAEPQTPYHASAIQRVDYALRAVLPPGWLVRVQSPVSLDDESEPEPDLAVVPGHPGDYPDAHAARPALVIEVADSSLAFDRRDKGSLYARARLGLLDREPRRSRRGGVPEPGARGIGPVRLGVPDRRDADAAGGRRPLGLGDVQVAVADLLP